MSNRMRAYLQKLQILIDTHGHAVQTVAIPPYGLHYTVGLTPALGYELATTGIPAGFLNDVAARLKANEIADGEDIAGLANVPFRLRTITLEKAGDVDRSELVAMAYNLEYNPTKIRQLIWPDKAGVFPGESGYEHACSQDLDELARAQQAAQSSKH